MMRVAKQEHVLPSVKHVKNFFSGSDGKITADNDAIIFVV
jgi:hypothetical protein